MHAPKATGEGPTGSALPQVVERQPAPPGAHDRECRNRDARYGLHTPGNAHPVA
ncbi:MAG: hypothetical protein ACP5HG_15860 [Anaerolineae bacterium]